MKKYMIFLLLAGCGFQPMYSQRDTDIYVAPISGINGIELRNDLNAKFGGVRDASATYTLKINLHAPITRYKALESTGDATWQEIVMTADYTLSAGKIKQNLLALRSNQYRRGGYMANIGRIPRICLMFNQSKP